MWEYFDTFVMMWDKLPELKFFQEPACVFILSLHKRAPSARPDFLSSQCGPWLKFPLSSPVGSRREHSSAEKTAGHRPSA